MTFKDWIHICYHSTTSPWILPCVTGFRANAVTAIVTIILVKMMIVFIKSPVVMIRMDMSVNFTTCQQFIRASQNQITNLNFSNHQKLSE